MGLNYHEYSHKCIIWGNLSLWKEEKRWLIKREKERMCNKLLIPFFTLFFATETRSQSVQYPARVCADSQNQLTQPIWPIMTVELLGLVFTTHGWENAEPRSKWCYYVDRMWCWLISDEEVGGGQTVDEACQKMTTWEKPSISFQISWGLISLRDQLLHKLARAHTRLHMSWNNKKKSGKGSGRKTLCN